MIKEDLVRKWLAPERLTAARSFFQVSHRKKVPACKQKKKVASLEDRRIKERKGKKKQ